MNSEIDRKIAVIFVADVVGYSKHMERDENATIKSYSACEKILNELLKKYKGSVFNTGGDSALVEFPSAVNAVECGVAFQNEIKKRNASDNTEVKLAFRIGINMGDVVNKDGNLIGDGVNIAARLEALAQKNGITISKSVYDFVVPKTKMTFNDLGVQKVKQNEFHAFDILLDPSQKRTLKTKSRSITPIIGTVVAAIALMIAVFYLISPQSALWQASLVADEAKKRVLGRNLLIATFKNKSGSTEFDYIAEGISDHLTTSLTSKVLLNIIPKIQSYEIADKKLTFKELIDKYDISYLLNGTTLVSGDKFRINLELIDIHQEKLVWGTNKEYSVNDVFIAQDDVEFIVLRSLQNKLTMGASLSKSFVESFTNSENYKKILNLRFIRHSDEFTFSEDSDVPYRNLLVSMPENSMLNYLFAKSLLMKVINFHSNDRKKDIVNLENALKKSILLNPKNPLPYALLGLIKEGHMLGNFDKDLGKQRNNATKYIEKSLELGPKNMESLFYSGKFYQIIGNFNEAIKLFEQAIEIAPFGPEEIRINLVSTHLANFDFDKASQIAISLLNQGDKRSIFIGSMFLIYIKAKTGEIEDAKNDFRIILDEYNYTKEEALYQIRRYSPGTWTWISSEFKSTMENL